MQEFISIIIPVYNRAHLIEKTLDSIRSQSYINWECLVIDDGSTDSTKEIIKSYIEKDSRFKYFDRPKNKPKGANSCRNYGLEISKGDFVNWFDSDDIMHQHKLKKQITELKKGNAPYCICQSMVFDMERSKCLGLRSSEISSSNRFRDYILQNIVWLTTAPLWRKSFLDKHSLRFDESLHQSQEYDFHIRALKKNSDYIVINEALVTINRHRDSISFDFLRNEEKIKSNLKVKGKILKNYSNELTQKSKIKIYESETLMFKELLIMNELKLARKVLIIKLRHLAFLDLTFWKKFRFKLNLYITFISYLFFRRGYNFVQPIKL